MIKSKVNPDMISLVGLRITKSHFEVDTSVLDDPKPIEFFNTGCKSESAFNIEENYQLFRIFIRIQGFNKDNSEIKVRGEYHLDFHYIIENLKEFITQEKDSEEYSVDSNLGATIAGISYSTSRGIILDRTQTTDFNGVILPIIDPHKLLNEDTYSEMS